MENKPQISTGMIVAAVAVLAACVCFIAFRGAGAGAVDAATAHSAPGGTQARTTAPVVQHYPDGSVVPYPAAPAGARPGDPSSIRR